MPSISTRGSRSGGQAGAGGEADAGEEPADGVDGGGCVLMVSALAKRACAP